MRGNSLPARQTKKDRRAQNPTPKAALSRRIELRDNMLLSTLRRRIETMGGKLVLIAELSRGARLAREVGALSVERVEWEHIQRVLRDHDNNISATARALSMHRRTLQRKLQKPPRKN